ncbi:hypothetical protein ACIRCZ_20370 [Leifsonia sp. NPDC102414]|uniref:hypothetical protein n=1 Tax=Leifsonia sp. NPDC102414 TaxID=3364124 RepID=UPI003800BF55
MESVKPNGCPLHGGGAAAQSLVGRLLAEVVASRHVCGDGDLAAPLDVWLIDDRGATVRVTTGPDGCLIVEKAEPHTGYDMGDSGRITVGAIGNETPFADYVGESILAVQEEHEPNTGRVALELSFPRGRVRCESWAGDLRLTLM